MIVHTSSHAQLQAGELAPCGKLSAMDDKCPACGGILDPETGECPDCGGDPYQERCGTCGEPKDGDCPNCGADYDALTTGNTDSGEVHILPSERSGNGRHQVMVIDANGNSQWPTQYEPGRYGWDNPEAVTTPTHVIDQAHEYARALDRTRGTKDAPVPNAEPRPNQYGLIPFHVPGNVVNAPDHPDPWMDNEPGTLTLPEHWGKRRRSKP